MPLITAANLHEPGKRYFQAYSPGDDFYEALIDTHQGLSDEQSLAVNARLVLLLANHIGDISVLAGYLWLLVTWGLHLRGKPAGGAPKRKPRGAARKPARA